MIHLLTVGVRTAFVCERAEKECSEQAEHVVRIHSVPKGHALPVPFPSSPSLKAYAEFRHEHELRDVALRPFDASADRPSDDVAVSWSSKRDLRAASAENGKLSASDGFVFRILFVLVGNTLVQTIYPEDRSQ